MLRAIAFCAILCVALFTTVASAQSDLEPPTLVSLSVSPQLVNASLGDQVVTVTAHIRDNLSGCSDNCLSVYFVPRFGPRAQTKLASFHSQDLITGTLTNGIYQTSILLPQYSYEGEWVIDTMYLSDRVRNSCGLPSASAKCAFDMPLVHFTNVRIESLNLLPALANQPSTPTPTRPPIPTPTPTLTPSPDNFPFLLGENSGQCVHNAGNTFFSGFVRDLNNNRVNGVCVHIAFYEPRGTKCSGCDGVGDGVWGFSPFGGPAKGGEPIEIFVVACEGAMPPGGQTSQTGFGNLTPQSPKWTHTLNGSEECTGITFYKK